MKVWQTTRGGDLSVQYFLFVNFDDNCRTDNSEKDEKA